MTTATDTRPSIVAAFRRHKAHAARMGWGLTRRALKARARANRWFHSVG